MPTTLPSMSPTNDPSDSAPNKRRRVETQSDSARGNIPWRSESRRKIYSTKLVEALFRARSTAIASSLEDPAATSGGGGGVVGEVRGIADRVLATAAKGRTRWSRAILGNRIRVTRRHRRVRPVASVGARGNRLRKEKRLPLPAVEKRVKVLSRLVPGCRGISVTSLLEEATDYIAALEMQVKAMTALSQLLGAPPVRSSSLSPALAPANDDGDDVAGPSARC